MFSNPAFLIIFGMCVAVAVVLALGISQMGKGGEEGAQKSNKFMQLRIALQFLAVIALLLFGMSGAFGN